MELLTKSHRFDAFYREQAELRDGRKVTLRLLRPEDRELLQAGFDRLSPTSRYRRFFCAKTRLSEAELDYLTNIDGENHFALGAVADLDESHVQPLGIARFVRLPDEPTVAEAAIAVIDEMQGQRLGKQLLYRLAQAARERGIGRFRCTVLADNEPMQELILSLDPEAHVSDLAAGARQIDLALSAHPDETHPHGLLHSLERLISMAARGLVRLRLDSIRDPSDEPPA